MLTWLRLGFATGRWLAPEATLRRSGDLFCRPLPSSRRRALATPTHDAVESTIEVDGERLHLYRWGDATERPVVLLAHGWSSHATRFAAWVAPLLAEGYAVVAFDQAAHGRSSGCRTTLPDFACNLLAVAARIGPVSAVVAHSLGGAATMLALAQGLDATRVVLIAPPADPVAAAERFARLLWLREGDGRRMFVRFEEAMRIDVDDLQAHLNVPAIARPALIVHDLEDRDVPWAEGERYARFWPGARLMSTRGLGHNRIAGAPEVVSAALRFLRGETVGEPVVSTRELPFGVA